MKFSILFLLSIATVGSAWDQNGLKKAESALYAIQIRSDSKASEIFTAEGQQFFLKAFPMFFRAVSETIYDKLGPLESQLEIKYPEIKLYRDLFFSRNSTR